MPSIRKFATLLPAIAAAGLLSACIHTEPQEFAVTGATPSPPGTLFRTSDPNINDVQAREICADGYEKLSERTIETEGGGSLTEWRVRCVTYGSLDFL